MEVALLYLTNPGIEYVIAGSGRCRSFISKKSRKFQLFWSLLALSVNISLKKIREKVCMYCYLGRVII